MFDDVLAEESIQKKKGRKNQFLFTAQLLRKNNFSANYQRGKIWKIAHKNKKRITAVTH
jgi:hypothetical protein